MDLSAVEPAALWERARGFLALGGPVIWAIAALSVFTTALIFWKLVRLSAQGAFGGRGSRAAIRAWSEGRHDEAFARLGTARSYRSRLVRAAMTADGDPELDEFAAREETERVAKGLLAEAREGLRALELIAGVAPLLGLLGTVLGMIGAFRTLEASGARADPAALAGGIWEALLTTAAGMAVAIPASVALAWFDGIVERLRLDMEDAATRVLVRPSDRSLR